MRALRLLERRKRFFSVFCVCLLVFCSIACFGGVEAFAEDADDMSVPGLWARDSGYYDDKEYTYDDVFNYYLKYGTVPMSGSVWGNSSPLDPLVGDKNCVWYSPDAFWVKYLSFLSPIPAKNYYNRPHEGSGGGGFGGSGTSSESAPAIEFHYGSSGGSVRDGLTPRMNLLSNNSIYYQTVNSGYHAISLRYSYTDGVIFSLPSSSIPEFTPNSNFWTFYFDYYAVTSEPYTATCTKYNITFYNSRKCHYKEIPAYYAGSDAFNFSDSFYPSKGYFTISCLLNNDNTVSPDTYVQDALMWSDIDIYIPDAHTFLYSIAVDNGNVPTSAPAPITSNTSSDASSSASSGSDSGTGGTVSDSSSGSDSGSGGGILDWLLKGFSNLSQAIYDLLNSVVGAISSVVSALLDGIKALFVPEDGYFSEYISKWQDWFDGRFGLLSFPFTFLAGLVTRFSNITLVTDPAIVIPGLKIGDYVFWDEFTYNFDYFGGVLGTVHQIALVASDCIIAVCLFNLLRRKLDNILGGGDHS